jgi:hypothetical protein
MNMPSKRGCRFPTLNSVKLRGAKEANCVLPIFIALLGTFIVLLGIFIPFPRTFIKINTRNHYFYSDTTTKYTLIHSKSQLFTPKTRNKPIVVRKLPLNTV